jgi:hypothetical protein
VPFDYSGYSIDRFHINKDYLLTEQDTLIYVKHENLGSSPVL